MQTKAFWTVAMLLLLAPAAGNAAGTRTLTLATTTSTDDSGLLAAILPDFERQYNARVRVVAVGTGQALRLARDGNADVVLVHAREQEEKFVAEGFGRNRREVMYNDFVLVGPHSDALGLRRLKTAAAAFRTIARQKALFVSRGDRSGTHLREQAIWKEAGIRPAGDWYLSIGQGMGATLILANEKNAYTLSDRGTFLAMQERLPDLDILVGGSGIADNPDPSLRNPYGVIAVSPQKHPQAQYDLALQFIRWITSPETQKRIAHFGVEKFGQPLFHPVIDEGG